MKTLSVLLAFLTCLSFQSFSQTWQWTHPEPNGIEVTAYPDPYLIEDDKVHDVETDAAGNIYVLGNFMDSLYLSNNFITKNNGSYLAKYDSTGKLLWYKLIIPTSAIIDIGGGPRIYATDLAVNANGVYITGKYAGSGYAIDYDCSTGTGTLTLRSYSIGGFNFNSAGTDIGFFLTKFNSNGNVVWNKTARDPGMCIDNNPVWPNQIPTNPVVTSDNAGNIVCGFVCITTKGAIAINNDIINLRASDVVNPMQPTYLVVAKYNSAGTLQWSNNAGGGFNTTYNNGGAYQGFIYDCNSLISDKNNNIYFHGTATDSTFFGSQLFRTNASQATFISKISSAGVWQFAKELSNTTADYVHAGGQANGENPEKLAVDTSNNVYALVQSSGNPQEILGTTVSTGGTNTSCYLVKMKNNGILTWIKSFGSTEAHTYTNSIHYNNNNLYFCGANSPFYTADQKLVFSSLYVPPVSGYLNNEFYAAKADLNGNFIWVTTFQDGGYSAYGTAIKAFNGNIYIGGEYAYKITSLGNLNGSFTNSNPGIGNSFFGKLKDQYTRVGVVTPTNIIPGCTITVPFTSTGLTFSVGNTFTAELSNASGDFTTPTAIGTTSSTGTGTITATIPASLTYGSGYRVRIHSSDTLKTGLGYYAYADTLYKLNLICPPPSSGFTSTNITATSATLNWTAVGCASGYKVQYRVKGTTAWATLNITTNTPTLNISGLTANTIYQWKVATKCKNNGVNSFSAFSSVKQFTTAATGFAAADAQSLQFKTFGITVYPNPATNNAVILFNTSKTTKYQFELTDISGKVLQIKTGETINGENKIMLDMRSYAKGMYLIQITDDEYGIRALKLNKK